MSKKHSHPCSNCGKSVKCWWPIHDPKQLEEEICDACSIPLMVAWEELKEYYR